MGFAKDAMKIWVSKPYQVNQDWKKDLQRQEIRAETAKLLYEREKELKAIQTKNENNIREEHRKAASHLGNIIDTYA